MKERYMKRQPPSSKKLVEASKWVRLQETCEARHGVTEGRVTRFECLHPTSKSGACKMHDCPLRNENAIGTP